MIRTNNTREEAIENLWQDLEAGMGMLHVISAAARALGYLTREESNAPDPRKFGLSVHGSVDTYWDRNAMFAMFVLLAEGEEI